MAFALRLRNEPRAEIDARVRRAAEALALESVLQRKPRQLSGGQRQRVAIGRAIVREPQVFLFDEPLSNLDAKLRLQMRREIATLHRDLRATMIYVTHDQVEAMTLGDRIVVMNAGEVQQIDAPLTLYHRPRNRFVATFIGSPAMSIIDGTVVAATEGLTFRTATGRLVIALDGPLASRLAAYSGRQVALGIRPEDVGLAARAINGPAARIVARVDAVEPTGSDALVYARTDDFDLTARLPADTALASGAPVELAFALDRVHSFDGKTGAALDRDGEPA
jgi:multiple sugar transport system ATP-binding protein